MIFKYPDAKISGLVVICPFCEEPGLITIPIPNPLDAVKNVGILITQCAYCDKVMEVSYAADINLRGMKPKEKGVN